jgi:hypothetical protein
MANDIEGECGNQQPDGEDYQPEDESPFGVPLHPKIQTGDHDADPKQPNWVEKWTFYVLLFGALAACVAAYEAGKLANDTETALSDARIAALTAHGDNIDALNNGANAIGEAQAFANAQHVDTLKALELTRRAADAAKKSANAATEGNRIARAAFITDQRPWISLDVSITGPLAYTAEGWAMGLRWNIPLQYTLKQMGKTPATNVSVFGEIIPFINTHFTEIKDGRPFGLPAPGTNFTKEIEGVCAFPERLDNYNMGWGTVMFPTEQATDIFGLNGNPARFDAAKGENKGYIGQFLVIMCVTYRSTLDDSRYRTAKTFYLFKGVGNGIIDLAGETIPPKDLSLVLTPNSTGSYAR